MLVVGLLSTKQEAQEIQQIAKICIIEDRVRFIVRKQKIKEMLENKKQLPQ